jgi:hypothetical protein
VSRGVIAPLENREQPMKKALIVALIACCAVSSSAYAAGNTKDGCEKTFWNSKWFGQLFGVGQCKG